MSDAFIVRRGGGGELFATISVKYPSGSVCTCTKGTKTLTAKGTGGSYIFYVPETGTWTVSCTDGTRTSSEAVVIISKYQNESVNLFYAIVLIDGASYKAGVGLNGDTTISTTTTTTNFARPGTGYGCAYWRDIDLTGKSTLISVADITPVQSDIGTRALRIWNNTDTPNYDNSIADASFVWSGESRLSVSELSGIYTVGFSLEYLCTVAVSQLYIE